jgi:hypothetical protein
VSELLHVVGGETEVDELVVLDVLGVLEVDLSSLQVIVGVLKATVTLSPHHGICQGNSRFSRRVWH